MERDGEPALVPVLDGPRRADDARAPRNEHPLAVGRIQRHRHHGEHGAGELARELGEQHGLQERALADPLPAGRVQRPDAEARLSRAGHARYLSVDSFRESRIAARLLASSVWSLGFKRRDRLSEGREHRVQRGLGRSGLRRGAGAAARRVRIPVGAGDGKRAERARPPFDLFQPERLAQLVLGLDHPGRPHLLPLPLRARHSSAPLSPPAPALFGVGFGLPAFPVGAGLVGRRLLLVPLGVGAHAAIERPARALVHGPRLGRGGSHGVLLGTRERRREQHAGDEHADQRDPGLRDDPARQRAPGLLDPLLPAAHRASLGSNRQRSPLRRRSGASRRPARGGRRRVRPRSESNATRLGSPSWSS